MNRPSRQALAEMARRMMDDDDFLILTHRRPDGDTVGSAVALCIALRRIGKRAGVCDNPETISGAICRPAGGAQLDGRDRGYCVVFANRADRQAIRRGD